MSKSTLCFMGSSRNNSFPACCGEPLNSELLCTTCWNTYTYTDLGRVAVTPQDIAWLVLVALDEIDNLKRALKSI